MPDLVPLFIDSAYLIALRSPDDNWRQAAIAAAKQIPDHQPMVTSDGIILETLAHFSRAPRAFRVQLVGSLQVLRHNPLYTFVPHHKELMDDALALYGNEFAASSLSLQDCVSILIMREYGINSILTADQEFTRAGFTPLLRRYLV